MLDWNIDQYDNAQALVEVQLQADQVVWHGWYVNDARTVAVRRGQPAEARIELAGVSAGFYRIRVRRDIETGNDETVAVVDTNYEDSPISLTVPFIVSFATGEEGTRGYHVDIQQKIAAGVPNTVPPVDLDLSWMPVWIMGDGYPPRLKAQR